MTMPGYCLQIYELHSKNLDLEKRNDKAEFESKRSKEKLQMLEAENEVRRIELYFLSHKHVGIYFRVNCYLN